MLFSSLFGEPTGFDAAKDEPEEQQQYDESIYNFCIHCGADEKTRQRLNYSFIPGYAIIPCRSQVCSLCRCTSYARFYSRCSWFELRILRSLALERDKDLSVQSVGKAETLTKEEKYQAVFNYTVSNPTVQQMSNEALTEHIHLLESALEDLLFEKRTEIQALRHVYADKLDNASEHERERIKKLDQDYTRKRQKAEGEKIEARREKISKKEAFVRKMISLGVAIEKAEEMAKDIK